jgi:DNA-binding MarR family transcriptional regulator
VNVGAVARALHVSSAFIASESGKLARRGLLLKRTSPQDRRGVLLSVSPAGRSKIDGISKQIRTVNDLFFGVLGAGSFAALSAAANTLVESSVKALQYLNAVEEKPKANGQRRTLGAACMPPRHRVPTKRACDHPPVWQRRTNSVE